MSELQLHIQRRRHFIYTPKWKYKHCHRKPLYFSIISSCDYQANKDSQNADHPYSQSSVFECIAGGLILWIISLFKEGGL